jgi:tRNA (guanine37-N1)-methyltransferase
MRISVVTLFPDFFRGPLSLSIPARAAAAGLVRYDLVQLRDFTHDRHQSVDDLPYGGGSGMVMKPEPFWEAVESLAPAGAARPGGRIVLMSARGKRFTHEDAVRLAVQPELTLLCGHYKDVDHRVAEGLADEELSLGDFVLSDHESASTDSFYDGALSPPSYTRPAEYRGLRVPEVLLSGDHAKIAAWRREQGVKLTRERRPELLEEHPEHG